jgi:hypothetical protein
LRKTNTRCKGVPTLGVVLFPMERAQILELLDDGLVQQAMLQGADAAKAEVKRQLEVQLKVCGCGSEILGCEVA